jgi:hypothetical protein
VIPNGWNPTDTARVAGGLFFPQSKRLGIDLGHYSPAVLERVIYAGTHQPSFERASQALLHLADLQVPTKQVERLTQRIGVERCAERDAEVRAYGVLPLAERKSLPEDVAAPVLAVVQVDGGRLQILDRSVIVEAGQAAAGTATPAGHWREDKVGLLATMTSAVSRADPCPAIPEQFVDPLRILKLTREIKGSAGVAEEEVPTATSTSDPSPAAQPSPYTAPVLEQRSVVATREDVHAFGAILAQAVWARGFYGASRRAFIADGSSANWGVWERHFSNFIPIVDFIHALSYVFQAAMTGQSFTLGWAAYTTWIAQVWAGQIEPVIAALAQRQVELGPPGDDEPETSPRTRVAEALGYLQNQKERMRYAEYRKQGLPITSSHIESTIKQINQRVKGTEKFWSPNGAEAILQLRADVLSETEPLVGFWERRQARATGQRAYSRAA